MEGRTKVVKRGVGQLPTVISLRLRCATTNVLSLAIKPDSNCVGLGQVSANRLNFLLEALQDLDSSLQKRQSRLIVLRGKPQEVLPRVLKAWNVSKLCFE